MDSVDKSTAWTKVVFQSSDAIEVTDVAGDGRQIRGIRKLKPGEQPPSDALVVKDGWDHEHCEVCRANINPGDHAYTNECDLWLCLDCFEAGERAAK